MLSLALRRTRACRRALLKYKEFFKGETTLHLKYIEIQGFKSFPDKVRLGFETGITGIVGPNGSGKSNISDAVRWVLGEQSTKSLRGGKMEDVIFGGTQLRKPMGFAQVSLCLDNADEKIKDLGNEIIVTRRYYRSGDSEYLLNGSTVRLRDVRETFMDTGLGRDGYSIIGQGRIAEVVNSKSEERREIFEEASGIAKFRFRKTEAERKLTAANENLERLRDIIDELEARIGPLEEQSKKAKQFLELSEERRSLEITYYCDIIAGAKEKLRTQDDKIAISKQDYETIERQLEEANGLVDKLFNENNMLGARVNEYNDEIVRTSERVAEIESENAVRRNNIEHGAEQLATLTEERDKLSLGENALAEELNAKRALIDEKKTEVATLDGLIAACERELTDLIENNESSDQKRVKNLKRLTEVQNEITDLKLEAVAASSSIEALGSRESQINEQLASVRERLETARKDKAENDGYFESINADINEHNNRFNGFKMKRDSRAAKRDELSTLLDKKNVEIYEATRKIELFKELDKSMDGYAPSVKRVAEAQAQRRLRGIIGTVGSLIEIKKGCELAIETALGAAIQNVIVENEASAKEAIAFLKETHAGRATFLPVDTIKPSNFDERGALSGEGVVGLASELVSCNGKYADIVSSLLGRIVVTETLDNASVLARKLRYRYRVVSMDGQVINAGGSYTGGSTSRQAGVFSRKVEIENLEKKIEQIKGSMANEENELSELSAEIVSLEAEMTAINSDIITLNEDRIRIESTLTQQNREVAALAENVSAGEAELSTISAAREEKLAVVGKNEGSVVLLENEAARLSAVVSADDDNDDELLKRRNELSEDISAKKISRAELLKDIESIENGIEQLGRQGTDANDRAANIDAAIARITDGNRELEKAIEVAEAEIESLREQSKQRRLDIENAGETRKNNELRITELREKSNEITKQRELISNESARLEERKAALATEYERYVARLWEEYELSLDEAERLCVPFESASALHAQVSSIRAKIKALGNVNVGAIEEFKEVSERYAFLSEQVGDVEKSKEELMKLISELETDMREIFTKSFNEINNRFRRVFVELFGGGSANLSLTDETDVLESGIELDVQPPGKVIKNLSALSGGEQSLVAIALYFSILSVNPSPFCILDEIDSALDESNVVRFANYISHVIDHTQIITITHRRGTMEASDVLYGVTMQEEGVSKVLKLGIEEAQLVISK